MFASPGVFAGVGATGDGDNGLGDCHGMLKVWLDKGKRWILSLLRQIDPLLLENNLPDLTRQINKESNRYPVAQGNLGDVWKCTHQAHHRLVAVKCLRVDIQEDGFKQRFYERLDRELRQYTQLKHSNLLPLLGTTRGFGPLPAIVTPWMSKGTLTMLLEHNFEHLSSIQKLQTLNDAASALQYLHSEHIVHGDLTSNNILIDENDKAYLSDHGILNLCSELSGTSYITNNVRWAAPENFRVSDDEKPTSSVELSCDVYSFGCIMLQVFTGKVPYSECRSDHQVVVQILRGKLPARPITPHIEEIVWEFIQKCWSDPEHRPSASAVLDFIRCQQKIYC